MKPRERVETGQTDLFRARLDQIIDMGHELVRLGQVIDWRFIDSKCGEAYSDVAGQPPLLTRLMAGLAILKHTYDLSDEELHARWKENPYFQYFCGEEFFCHEAPFDRSSLTRWRQRMGEEKAQALLQESLAVAVKTKAMQIAELREVVVDTTVQEKAATFPTDAKLLNRSRVRLVRLSKTHGVRLRQSYTRVGKLALIKHQRYAHAKQFKRANRQLRRLRTQLGRVSRDIERKIAGQPDLKLKKFGFDRTRINEVVGIFADCEGSEPEGERASQSAAQKSRAHNDNGTESHQSQGWPVGTGQAARQREPSLQDHGIQPR